LAGTNVKVFICHSAIGDAATEALIRALQASLEPDYACFVDWTELEVGRTWREPINTWLEHCDAAIVVLNHKALASPFVGYEVSELARRRRITGGAFCLIPIHVKNASPDLSVGYANLQTSHLGPWELHAIDAAVYDDNSADAAAHLADLIRTIKTRLEAAKAAQLPLVPQMQAIVALLKKPPEALVKEALALVDVAVRRLKPVAEDQYVQLALALRSLGLDGARPVIQLLRGNLCDPDNHWKEEHLRQLYDLLAMFWVDPHSAATISEVALGSHDERSLALDAARNEIALLYVRRACPKVPTDNEWIVVRVQTIGGEELGDAEFVTAKVRAALIADLRTTDGDLDEDLQSFDSIGNPVFVTLPASGISAARVTRLRRDFKTVTFLFLTRSLATQREEVGVGSHVRRVAPTLDAQDEDAFYGGYERNWRLLRPRCPQR